MTNYHRISRVYLGQLQSLLDKVEPSPNGAFEIAKNADGSWWMATTPEKLFSAGVAFDRNLSFMSWFAFLHDQGKAHLSNADLENRYLFRIGPNQKKFQDLIVTEPGWISNAKSGLELLMEQISAKKREAPAIRNAISRINMALIKASGQHAAEPVDQITEQQVRFLTTAITEMARDAKEDLESASRKIQNELDETQRYLKRERCPSQRSLTNYPDWQRAKERLSAITEIKVLFDSTLKPNRGDS